LSANSLSQQASAPAVLETAAQHAAEVRAGQRFQFGRNWRRFLRQVDESRIQHATTALQDLLGRKDLKGLTFLDVGSGSGLSSLAATRLGARVTSFDYDPESVAASQELKRRFHDGKQPWVTSIGSALDRDFLKSLGTFDIVYSWGVLHHTGAMYEALENVLQCMAPNGVIAIAIYNDQGVWSRRWARVKRLYCRSALGKGLVVVSIVPYWVLRGLLSDLWHTRNPIARYREHGQHRGMSLLHDWVDWLGGWPFEVAKPEAIFHWFRDRGYELVNLTTAGGTMGCNEFVFRRVTAP
jgi:2-polyprenyl-6-hydroxyphenyl methylase/3-demethylubiquinone-9 3-methyltransferase